MSVLKSQRNESKLTVLLTAEELVRYTLEVTANEKRFPKRHRWQITNRIVDTSVNMLQYLVNANSIRVEDALTKKQRKDLQDLAFRESVWLLELLNVAHLVFHVALDRLEYWTGLIARYQHDLKIWQKSDEKQYAVY